MIGKKNKIQMMFVTTRVKINTTVSETGRIYQEGEGEEEEVEEEEEEEREEEEEKKLLVLEEKIIENKSLL